MDSTENILVRLVQIQFSDSHSTSWKTEPRKWSFWQGPGGKSFNWEMTPEDIDRRWERETHRGVLGKVSSEAAHDYSHSSISEESGERCGSVLRINLEGEKKMGILLGALPGALSMGFRGKFYRCRSRGVGGFCEMQEHGRTSMF